MAVQRQMSKVLGRAWAAGRVERPSRVPKVKGGSTTNVEGSGRWKGKGKAKANSGT